MTPAACVLAAALAVSASDRLAMADRLFNRARYAEAKAEYRALAGDKALAADDIAYRLAECDRALGKGEDAIAGYAALLKDHPASPHAARARLHRALLLPESKRADELKVLDCDGTEKSLRASALFHIGTLCGDTNAYDRCIRLDPKGKYAPYARCRLAGALAKGTSDRDLRSAVSQYLEVAFGTEGDLAEEALYLAGTVSYRAKKYGEADSLFRRYLKKYPNGRFATDAISVTAWCRYLTGKYAEAFAQGALLPASAPEKTRDGVAYVCAASKRALGDTAAAKALFEKYLTDFPGGSHRASVELALARLALDAAIRANDFKAAVEAARRCAERSKSSADRLRLAWALSMSGENGEAARRYLDIAKDFPDTADAADALYRKAMLDVREDRWSAAELALREALSGKLDASYRTEAKYWRGVASVRLGHEEEGAALLREALGGNLPLKLSREARLQVADVDYRSGRTNEAVAAYRQLVREGGAERMPSSKIRSVGRLLGGEELAICARALTKGKSPEWRQIGHAMLGRFEEDRSSFVAAVAEYRSAVAEQCETDELPTALWRLGVLETRANENEAAEKTLRRAVQANAGNVTARAEAYLCLAKIAQRAGDARNARAYATVVVTLFDNTPFAAEAQAILKAVGEEK